jgi:two-component system, chemotaxis family, CheB/CheR fusion protein
MAKKKAAKRKTKNTTTETKETDIALSAPVSAESATAPFPIIGIGASAGGLDALRRVLEAMPHEPGVALVIIQHLDPTRRSLAPELLARHTKLQVMEVEDEPSVKPNRVYVIPPGKYLSISGGRLHLSQPDQPRGARMAIDFFLRSLSDDQERCAVGVILSGTGADGALGVKAIRAAGGLVIAQDPASAEFDGMPRSAIATGAVDHVLPPEKIPEVLVRYAQHPYMREVLAAAPADAKLPPNGLNAILALLRIHTRHDFHSYKEQTLVRRMRRRMSLYHIDDYEQYLKHLRERPDEIQALAKDLLITVTDFFRDPEAWAAVRRLAVAPLVEVKGDDEPIRAWAAGCATGEEPYSMAMLFLEELGRAGKHCPLQIFASDVERDALRLARAGRYPTSIAADVSPERLQRFFIAEDGDNYRVNKVLRDAVLFAEHNLIGDPPFSHLDLICCRNLLIYLKPGVQEKVIGMFHFALNEGAVLFLGNAETIGRQTDLFQTLDKRWRIFRSVGQPRRDRRVIPLMLSERRREIEPVPAQPAPREIRLTHLAQQRLLDVLAPTAVLIDRNWRIRHIFGNVDPYLSHNPDVRTDNLLDHARRGLRTKLRGAVHAALAEDKTVSVPARVQRDAKYAPVTIIVHVIRDREQREDLALVLFEEEGASMTRRKTAAIAPERPGRKAAQLAPGEEDRSLKRRVSDREAETAIDAEIAIHQLEEKLAAARFDLQVIIEQLETSNEEYRATHEEAMSANEELQTANEELEAGKEELQSLNEELSTVNKQLAAKVEELETKHADMENLLAATDVPTICLDTDLAVRWCNPAARRVIRLTPADIGRPLSDFTQDFIEDDLTTVAQRVLENLALVEDEISCRDGRTFLRRVTPYRTADHQIGGVVLTFVDITRRKQDEAGLRESETRFRLLFEKSLEAITLTDDRGRFLAANDRACQLLGYSCEQLLGMGIEDLQITKPPRAAECYQRYVSKGEETGELEFVRPDGQARVAEYSVVKTAPEQHLSILRDITKRKQAELNLVLRAAQQEVVAALGQRALEEESLQLLLDEAARTVAATLGNEFAEVLEIAPGGAEMLLRAGVGWKEGLVGRATVSLDRNSQAGYTLLTHGPVIEKDLRKETRFHGPSLLLEHGVVSGMSCEIRGPGGKAYGVLGTHTRREREFSEVDVAFLEAVANILGSAIQRKKAEQDLRDSESRLQAVVSTAADAIITISRRGIINSVNAATEQMFGYRQDELIGRNVKILMPPPYCDEHDRYLARFLKRARPTSSASAAKWQGAVKMGRLFLWVWR